MKPRSIITIVLLLFVGAAVVFLYAGGGDTPTTTDSTAPASVADAPAKHVVAYYFHGTRRCPTCEKLEAYANAAITTGLAEALASGALQFKSVNYDEPENAHHIENYQLTHQSIIVVEYADGQPTAWENLDQIWDLVGDSAAYAEYVQAGIRKHLGAQ